MNENLIRKCYFQSGNHENDPTPGKPKYKKDPGNDQNLTKARGVLFRNYDTYKLPGPDVGPGTGLYQHMDDYKSVSDFRKKKRAEKIRGRRKMLFAILAKTAVDKNHINDPLEDQVTEMPWNPSEPLGPLGLNDGIIPQEDLENKPVTNLYYGVLDNHYVKEKK